jgi:dimethylargininase
MFKKAIVRKPGKSMISGLSSTNLGIPDYEKALEQHSAYVEALVQCGLKVVVLEADENYPDSCFVEDTALLTPYCAIIANPGAESRKGETIGMKEALRAYFDEIEEINEPGTVEAGDIMMVGSNFFIGLSERTNLKGALQVIRILKNYGLTGSTIKLQDLLHLKTGVSYLENNLLLVSGELIDYPAFEEFEKIIVPESEAYAANSLWINGKILVPIRNRRTKRKIQKAGYEVIELEMSEFQKLDGGLSCLSLRF